MDPNHIRYLIKFLSRRKTIRVFLEKDSEACLFYGPCWVPVWCYVMKLLPYSEEEDAATLKEIMKLIVDLARLWTDFPEFWPEKEEEQEVLRIFLQDFVPRVHKFFKVPTKMFYCDEGASSIVLNQNEVLAAFIDFLVQIWNSEANRKGENDMPGLFQRYALVNKELKYLLTFLGDLPFQCCTTNKLDYLLNTLFAEFVTLANRVGHLTLCYISSLQPDRRTEFDADIDALLQIIKVFNETIKIYCIKFSELIPMPVAIIISRVTRPIDSLFIIDSLLDDIESLINRVFHVAIDTDDMDKVRLLCKELKISRKLLKETEIDGIIAVREVAYEAEYLINSYVVGNIPVWYFKCRLPSVIQKLNESRVQELKSDDNVSHVTKDFTGEISSQPTGTTLTVVEDHLVGIDEETKNEILDKLIGIGGSKSLQIISLVGMAGLGKTSLAKHLFDSSSHHFDKRAWSVISQNFVKREFFLEILMDVISDEEKQELADIKDEELGEKIQKSLYDRRYLIVIDDIWISKTWDDIKKYFPDHNKGSRIMLTSRIKNATPSESIFPTLTLSQVNSMNLLVKKVFLNEICPPQLLAIGNKIARRCNGLPLAVMAIAGVLANVDQEESVWEKVERDLDKFILDDDQVGCMKVLEFSYEHLPDHLKMCFLYLGTFPEDIKIPVQKILRLWVAEGFIEKVNEKCPEDVAYEYLHAIINRSLVLISKKKFDGRIKACRLHDLLRDLCLRKADDETFLKSTKVPFSTYMRHHLVRVDVRLSSHFGLHRRSFSGPLSTESYSFPQMPLHRVIDLLQNNDMHDRELGGIDMLFHLRYLCAPGRELSPQSASNFVNLEFLDILKFCGDGIGFSIILKMVKLKHLKLDKSCKCHFIIDCDNCQHPNLQSISTIAIDNLEDEKFLEYCPHLRFLKCHCCQPRFPDLSSTKLERLELEMTSRDIIIDLVNTILPRTIKKLNLSFSLSCDAMSIISGLPNLQVLNLFHGCFVEEVWEIKDGEFQKLKVLKLQGTGALKRCITYREPFPELQCLVLKDCPNLQDISRELRKISTLQEIDVHRCSYIFNKSVVQIEEEQHEIGNNKLQVKIINDYWSKEELVREYRKLKEAFRLYKENDDLGAAIRSLTGGHCPTEDELQRINKVDGSINFLDLIAKIRVPYSENDLQKASQFFDKEAPCGDITISDLFCGLEDLGQGLTRDELNEMADSDGVGILDYDEFKELMKTIDVPRPYDLRIALLTAKTSRK